MHPLLKAFAHRPYPPARGPWIARQSWRDLAFLHWRVPAKNLEALLPDGLVLDLFDGEAWVGIVPFRMSLAPRGLPFKPFRRDFLELNLRTYVRCGGARAGERCVNRDGAHPGVWFFSLDATDPLSVFGARLAFRLPYFDAEMQCGHGEDGIHFASRRAHCNAHASAAEFAATYAPRGDAFQAAPGSLEYFLAERYCLYAAGPRGKLYRCEIHHPPWSLQRAEVQIETNELGPAHGLTLSGQPDHVMFSRHQDVLTWPLRRL